MLDISIPNLVLIRLTMLNWYFVKPGKLWIYKILLWKTGFYDVIKWRHNFFDTSKVSPVTRYNQARFRSDRKSRFIFIASKRTFSILFYLWLYIYKTFHYSIILLITQIWAKWSREPTWHNCLISLFLILGTIHDGYCIHNSKYSFFPWNIGPFTAILEWKTIFCCFECKL